MRRNLQLIIPLTTFAILTLIYLVLTAQHLFFVVQSQDYFVYDWTHVARLSEQPGWVVPYVGSFLTQFAYHPLLGISLFTLLLTLLSWFTKWALRLPHHLSSLAIVPSVLVVAFVVGWDYGLFATRHYGNLFSPIVGLMVSVGIASVALRLPQLWMRYVWAAIVVICLYPWLGFYALLGILTATIADAWHQKLYALSVVAAVAIVPYVESRMFFVEFNSRYAWQAALPFMDYYKTPETWMPLYIAFVFVALIPLLSDLFAKVSERILLFASALVAAAAIAWVPLHRTTDSNFNTLLAVEHAYVVGEDHRVLDLCAAQEHPIRSLIMYRNIELWKRGELLDKMFQYSWVSDTIQSRNLRHNTYITGARVFQKYTFWNFSYRWAMERTVMYNPSYSDMQIMASDITYNQEHDLADKYLSQLENTLYYKDWAHSRRLMLEGDRLNTDSVTILHRQIVLVPHGAIDNTEYCEYMLLKYFTNLYALSPKRAELCLAASMILVKEDEFWQVCLAEVKADPTITLPRHVQEAALLFALKKQNPALLAQIKLMVGPQGSVCQQFERNQDLINRLLTHPLEGDAATLATLCPGTYWNYYFNDARHGTIFD